MPLILKPPVVAAQLAYAEAFQLPSLLPARKQQARAGAVQAAGGVAAVAATAATAGRGKMGAEPPPGAHPCMLDARPAGLTSWGGKVVVGNSGICIPLQAGCHSPTWQVHDICDAPPWR